MMEYPNATNAERFSGNEPLVIWSGSAGRRAFVNQFPLGKLEYLVEITDKYCEKHHFVVTPIDSEAVLVAQSVPLLRKALFSDEAEVRIKRIYRVNSLKGIKRMTNLKTGEIEDRLLNLFVVKRWNIYD